MQLIAIIRLFRAYSYSAFVLICDERDSSLLVFYDCDFSPIQCFSLKAFEKWPRYSFVKAVDLRIAVSNVHFAAPASS